MSLVGRSRSPLSEQHLPSWQRDLILKKRAMNRTFPRLYPQVAENGQGSNGDDSVGAFHPDSTTATSAMSIHAPSIRNNKLNNESDANGAFTPKERNWNDVRLQHTNPKQAEKLSEPSATLAHQQQQPPSPFVLNKQSRFGAGSAYFAFNGSKMGKDKGNVLTNNNALNSFNDVSSRGELNRMVTNGTATIENGSGDQTYGFREEESYENDQEYEYGPGIVNRLRSKFNSMTMRERELSNQTAMALLSPVRRVASLEHLLDMDDEESCAPMYRSRSPTISFAQRSSTLLVRSSMELLKRARSMETLSAIDRGPGVVVSASSIFGPRTTFRSFSKEDGLGPLSPVNDKVIIIEHPKPAPKTNGAAPGGQDSKPLPGLRVGQDLAWKMGTNAALIDEELPKPDTVRKNKQIFESELQATPVATSKTIIIRTRKLTPPPKPAGLKPGPKPALKVKPPQSPTPVSPIPAPTPPKKVFTYLQEIESAEKHELAVETTPPRTVSPTAAPPKMPVVTPLLRAGSPTAVPPKMPVVTPSPSPPPPPIPIPTTTPVPDQPATVSIVGETWKPSANFSQQISLPQAGGSSDAVLHNGFDAAVAHHHPHKAEAAAAPVKPVGAIKPFVQNSVAVTTNAFELSPIRTGDAETTLPSTTGKLVSANPGCVSVKYNFVGKDVKSSIRNTEAPFGTPSRPALGVSEEVTDEEEFSMDGLLAKPLNVDFVGDNVIVGRSALMKTRNKKLKLVFDDQALSTYEYPSENSLLEGEAEDKTVSRVSEEHSSLQNAIKVRASIEMGPSVLKSTPAIGSSLGGLSSYTPMVVGSTEAFELGVSRAPPPPPAPSKPEAEKDDSEESLFLKPATDDDNVLWSNAATSDILF